MNRLDKCEKCSHHNNEILNLNNLFDRYKVRRAFSMKTWIILAILTVIFYQSKVHSISNTAFKSDKLLKMYEEKQDQADLRLYYMVKSRLKSRNDKIYFLNLGLRDKKIYTKYLLKNSDVGFHKKRTFSFLF